MSQARPSGPARAVLRATVVSVVSAGVIVLVLPKVSGAPWHDIGAALSLPTPLEVGLLALLWAAGLVVHCRVLTAALPGLSVRRALTLNLTGSAVANVVPLGGGLGLGVNYLMVRRWGFTPGQFSLFTALVNAWHVTAKAVLPAGAVLLLVANDVTLRERLLVTATAGSGALLLVVAVTAAALMTRRGARVTGRVLDSLLSAVRRQPAEPMAVRLELLRAGAGTLVRSAWRPMTWGLLAYNALQVVLLWGCLAVVGGPLPLVLVVAVFAVERAVTALPLTPGGAGVVEIAATAMIVTLGGAPAAAAAGILLYRSFVFGLEIPVGGAWLLGWWLSQRGGRPVAA